MKDSIVERLLRNHNRVEFLEEDVIHINEADEDEEDDIEVSSDEEYSALNDESEEEDNSDEIDANDDEIDNDTLDSEPDSHPISSHSASLPNSPADEESPEEESPAEDSNPEKEIEEHENPLDNNYAVKFTMGDDVKLSFLGDAKTIRSGVVDGYDQEGFYRVVWSDGTSTNGMTDISLEELVRAPKMTESRCICGGSHFIKENAEIICDDCGRKLDDAVEDHLTKLDKKRPKGKRMIRSIPHEMSTSVKPNIADAAMSESSIREDDDFEEDENVFDKLRSLDNEFWTRPDEMRADIEDLGFYVDEMNAEYLIVSHDDDDENAYYIPVGGTSRTLTLDFDRARMI